MNRMTNGGDGAHPEKTAPAPGIRYHYMDNLRALAMLAGVVFHAALAYSPLLNQVWLPADAENSLAIDAVAWFSHLFRMPLFFLIAGFFACYLVAKRGAGGFLGNRALRILVPLVIFLPLVWLSIGVGVQWALENVDNPSPILGLIAMMADMPNAPEPPITTAHLWFLYNLVQFYVIYVILDKTGLLDRISAILASPRFLVFALPLMILPALATQTAPHPAPEQFMPKLWSFGFYGFFFLVGSAMFRQQDVIDRLRPYAPWMLVGSLVLYAVLFSQLPRSMTIMEAMAVAEAGVQVNAGEILTSLLEAIIAVHMTLVCLVYGKQFLDRASAPVRFVADSSYWIYIIHLPLVWMIQYRMLDTDWNLWVEFTIASVGTFAIGIVTYALFVRWTPIGWLLNGRRGRKPGPQAAARPAVEDAARP